MITSKTKKQVWVAFRKWLFLVGLVFLAWGLPIIISVADEIRKPLYSDNWLDNLGEAWSFGITIPLSLLCVVLAVVFAIADILRRRAFI